MINKLNIFKGCFLSAVKVTLRSALWLLKFMIPVTFIVSMLDYFGVVEYISEYIEPLFVYAGLDARGVLVFITSVFASIYSAIAVIATLGVDYRMAVILAPMILIAHNLIVESTIQKKTGYSFVGIFSLRIIVAFVVGVILNAVLPQNLSGNLILSSPVNDPTTLLEALKSWGLSIVNLAMKICTFIYLLNVLQNILREFKILDMLIKPFHPIIMMLGLSDSVTFLWLVANTLGLAYGGAIMIEGAKSGEISSEDISYLNTSIAITHSLCEDTFILFLIGIPLIWLIVPRLLFSIICVWTHRAVNILRSRKRVLA